MMSNVWPVDTLDGSADGVQPVGILGDHDC
jgi:hypothetical protein